VVADLAGRSSAEVDHPCGDWRTIGSTPLEAAVGSEASRMVVPLSRTLAEEARVAADVQQVHADNLVGQVEHYRSAFEAAVERIQVLEQQEARLRRRVRRLRYRLRRQLAPEEPVQPPVRRWRRGRRGLP
jgi:hypothetical protein